MSVRARLLGNWPEYLMEGALLGLFMLSACTFAALLEHPYSPLHQMVESPALRRALGGVAMGLTAVGLICSPWGKRSGAHINPCVTLSFLTLGRISAWDAGFYICAQFFGGLVGVEVASWMIGPPLRHSAVNYAVTVPGPDGVWVAFAAELLISFVMMTSVLFVSNSPRLARYTPYVAASLVAVFIFFEAPLSGMSMNPARTFGSAVPPQEWMAIWVYFTAPVAGMLVAATFYRFRRGAHRVFCAKLHHHNSERCIFRCNYGSLR